MFLLPVLLMVKAGNIMLTFPILDLRVCKLCLSELRIPQLEFGDRYFMIEIDITYILEKKLAEVVWRFKI